MLKVLDFFFRVWKLIYVNGYLGVVFFYKFSLILNFSFVLGFLLYI